LNLPHRIVVTDANVLINLMHVGRLGFCGRLPGYEFVVPEHVQAEIREPTQRATLDATIARGMLHLETITDLASITVFAELAVFLGRGEAACLALAIERGWTVASDEKKRFRREAEGRIGRDRILGTVDLFVLAIRSGLISVEQADADKLTLEQRRFRMPFQSFRELIQEP